MSKVIKETTAFERWAPRIIIGGILIVFLIMGFGDRPKGSEILWDKLHPFGFFDGLGIAMFLFGAIWLSGWLKPVYNPANSSKWNLICAGLLGLGAILFWFL